jgi:hypothetical protein
MSFIYKEVPRAKSFKNIANIKVWWQFNDLII